MWIHTGGGLIINLMGVMWMTHVAANSKQSLRKNIGEHLISSGNVLLDTITVLILRKFTA